MRIQTESQEFGHNFLMKKIVSMFAAYQIFFPEKNLSTSFDDVLTIIGNKYLYDSNKMFNLNLLWIAMYGIFRCSFDMWLMDVANKWKRDKNIDIFMYIMKENQRILCIKI